MCTKHAIVMCAGYTQNVHREQATRQHRGHYEQTDLNPITQWTYIKLPYESQMIIRLADMQLLRLPSVKRCIAQSSH